MLTHGLAVKTNEFIYIKLLLKLPGMAHVIRGLAILLLLLLLQRKIHQEHDSIHALFSSYLSEVYCMLVSHSLPAGAARVNKIIV